MTYGNRMPSPDGARGSATARADRRRVESGRGPDSVGPDASSTACVSRWTGSSTSTRSSRRCPAAGRCTLPRPAAWRLEYQLTLRRGENYEWTTDPGNPHRVPNPFGEKSEIRFPDYREPAWLLAQPVRAACGACDTPALRLEQPVPVTLWAPEGLPADSPAPLLVAHDGSDMADRGSLLSWATELSQSCRSASRCSTRRAGCGTSGTPLTRTTPTTSPQVVLPAIADKVLDRPGDRARREPGRARDADDAASPPGALSALRAAVRLVLHPAARPAGVRVLPLRPGVRRGSDDQGRPRPVGGRGPAAGARVDHVRRHRGEPRTTTRRWPQHSSGKGTRSTLRIVPDAHTMIGWRDAWFPALDELVESVL